MSRRLRNIHIFVCVALMHSCRPPASADIVVGGDRPVTIHVPSNYDPGSPTPLLLGLHGYCPCVRPDGSVVRYIGDAWGFRAVAEELGILYADPIGELDANGRLFWNATPACCNNFASDVDDSSYLRSVIDEARALLNVDERRIYTTGHSNGAWMSYRMACDHADVIAGIAPYAGATYDDPTACAQTGPVNILHIHGTLDPSVNYDGEERHPGAVESVEIWAGYNDCTLDWLEPAERLDITAIPGSETQPRLYNTGCDSSGAVELWTIEGHGHFADWKPDGETTTFASQVTDWLLDHPKTPAPRASFTVSAGPDSFSRDFDAAASTTPPGTNINAYEWDFGDGTTGEGIIADHTYETHGFYTVILTIRTDDDGRVDRRRQTILIPPSAGDVSPWSAADIGDTGTSAVAAFEGNDLIVFGGGNNISATNDNFHFLHQNFTGDTVLTARIGTIAPLNATSEVGLMFRESLEANSPHATVLFSQTESTHHVEFVRRRSLLSSTTSSTLR